MKLRAMRPAVTRAMGKPSKHLGQSAKTLRSRTPAKSTMASRKPRPPVTPYTRDSMKLYLFCTFSSTTPSTAQLVVMRGR